MQSETKYIRFNRGGFGNQIYFALQAYILSKKEQMRHIYSIPVNDSNSKTIYNMLKSIGLSDLIQPNIQEFQLINSYAQKINSDFTLNDIYDFINDKIVNSSSFNNLTIKNKASTCFVHNRGLFIVDSTKNKIVKPKNFGTCILSCNKHPTDKTLGIHIRCKDFIDNDYHDVFDRTNYLISAIEKQESIKEHQYVHVFSDDINMVKREYHSMLKSRFKNITYCNQTPINDFIRLIMIQDKILWNSTFSYWSAFISDVLYKNQETIVCPDKFTLNESAQSHINPRWITIKTIPK